MGVVDQVVAVAELLSEAEKWVLSADDPQQPWDRKGFKVPGGSGLNNMNVGRLFQQLTAKVCAEYKYNYPAPIAILSCLFNGTTVRSMDAALKIESREFSALTRDPVARNMIRTLFINRGKASRKEIMALQNAGLLKQRCEAAYISQGVKLASEGVKRALIENAARAAGLTSGPLSMSEKRMDEYAANQTLVAAETVKQRLLCSQALAAAECWEEGLIDPRNADLISTMGWGFPSYTGGVMSYIDTTGLKAFICLCDELSTSTNAELKPSQWLRSKAQKEDRIYPSTA